LARGALHLLFQPTDFEGQIMNKWTLPTLLASLALLLSGMAPAAAATTPDADGYIALHYSDGTPASVGLDAVNARLRTIGVRVTEVPIPAAAQAILQASRTRAVTKEESAALLGHFQLGRKDLLQEIVQAGRAPAMPRGGYLQTSEIGVAPYPKVYDMLALDAPTTAFIQRKFGRLHVNSSEAGVGIDEVMTIVSGGPSFRRTWWASSGSVGWASAALPGASAIPASCRTAASSMPRTGWWWRTPTVLRPSSCATRTPASTGPGR
jgi:hypothetical protein